MKSLATFFKAAADPTRLRILRLLLAESLNVGEIQSILGLAQSSVSKHLAALKGAGLVSESRDGGFAFYAIARDGGGPRLELLRVELAATADDDGDLARLQEVLRTRSDRGDGREKLVEPGRSWVAWARALRFLLPKLRVADLGCGDGALTVEIASWAKSVIAVERDAMLAARARERVSRAGVKNVTVIEDDIERWRSRARSLDLCVVSHVLHYPGSPSAILAQAARALVPGGRALVLELAPHDQGWVREKLGHERLGVGPTELEKWLTEAGFGGIEIEVSPAGPRFSGGARKPFKVLIGSGVRS